MLPPSADATPIRGSRPEVLALSWQRAATIKRNDRTAVLRLDPPVEDESQPDTPPAAPLIAPLIAKCVRLETRLERVRARLGQSQLAREARAARRLGSIVPTPETLALARGRPRPADLSGASLVEALITPVVPGRTLLHACAQRAADDLTEPVGTMIGTLARRRLVNRDHKPSNLMVSPDRRTITLIDPAGIARTLRPRGAIERMITSIVIETSGTCGPPAGAWLEAVAGAALGELDGRDPSAAEVDRLLKGVDRRVATHLNRSSGVPQDDPLAGDDLARAIEGEGPV